MKMIKIFWNKVKDYYFDESGQTSIEYILLLVVVASIIFKFKSQIDGKITDLLNKVFGEKMDNILNDKN